MTGQINAIFNISDLIIKFISQEIELQPYREIQKLLEMLQHIIAVLEGFNGQVENLVLSSEPIVKMIIFQLGSASSIALKTRALQIL